MFAMAAAPVTSYTRLPHIAFWTWLHLLQFCIANQVHSIDEDAQNKPFRPLPSRRITATHALILRWLLVPICLAYSALYSGHVLYASVSMLILTICYNELHGDANHWLVRNILNALGTASFEWGATLLAGESGVMTHAHLLIAPQVPVSLASIVPPYSP